MGKWLTPKWIAIGCGSVASITLAFIVLLVVVVVVNTRGKQSPAPTDAGDSSPRLSEEYWPHTPGRVRQYVAKNYKDARYSGSHRTTDMPDGSEKLERTDGTGGASINYRRVQDGFIESGYKKAGSIYYEPHFKIGAKVGESWKNKNGNVTYAYSEAIIHNGTSCVVITLKQFENGDHYYTSTNWYMKGIGVVRYDVQRKSDGKWVTEKEITYKEW